MRVIATEELSVSRFTIRESLHSDSYPLPPTGSPHEPYDAAPPKTSRPDGWPNREANTEDFRGNSLK